MKCCICGQEIKHPLIQDYFGNNPWPINKNTDARCCDFCNETVVVPERIRLLIKENK